MNFYDWNTLYAIRPSEQKKVTWEDFYTRYVNEDSHAKACSGEDEGFRVLFNRALIEGRWYYMGQPYFKIWPKLG